MARIPSSDRRYLELKNGKWRVTMAVPRDLRNELGSRLKRSLHTDSLAVANGVKWQVVSEFRAAIEGARNKGVGKDPLRQEAMEVSEYRSRAQTEGEREMVEDSIRHRAEDLLGNPVRSDADPMTGNPTYEYDPERQKRADAYFAIAIGRATPIELHHEAFLVQSTTKVRTKADDIRAIKYLRAWCERHGMEPALQVITRRTAVQFMDQMREVAGNQQPITLNKYLNRLSRYWQWLALRSHVEFDPWAKLKVPAPPRNHEEEERAFTDSEVLALLSGPASQRMQDLMRIGALTGARLDAIVDLRVRDCADGLFVFKPQKKEAKPRPVPVHSELAAIIKRRVGGKAADDSVFPEWPAPKKAGSQRERSFKASNAFTAYRRSVGVDHVVPGKRRSLVNFHSFRRWFITKAEQADQPENIIAAVVGHKRAGMTLGRYSAGPLLEQARKCVESVKLPAPANVSRTRRGPQSGTKDRAAVGEFGARKGFRG
jgi:integrase